MGVPTEDAGVPRNRLFFGTCLALIPTGASFALVSNILVPLKQEFILTNYQVGLIGGAALWGMAISLLVPTGEMAVLNLVFNGDALTGDWSMPGDGGKLTGKRM